MNTNRLPSCLCGAIIATVGFFYFVVYAVQFLLFHLPTSLDVVPLAVLILAFALGLASCYLYTALNYLVEIVSDAPLADEGHLIKLVGIISMWATALPITAFLLPLCPWVQLGYLVGYTVVALGHLALSDRHQIEGQTSPTGAYLLSLSIIMLALMPTMQTLAGPASLATPLGSAFLKLLVSNIFGLVIYLLQPLEHFGIPYRWRASFHVMHLITTCAIIFYSREVMQVASLQSLWLIGYRDLWTHRARSENTHVELGRSNCEWTTVADVSWELFSACSWPDS